MTRLPEMTEAEKRQAARLVELGYHPLTGQQLRFRWFTNENGRMEEGVPVRPGDDGAPNRPITEAMPGRTGLADRQSSGTLLREAVAGGD